MVIVRRSGSAGSNLVLDTYCSIYLSDAIAKWYKREKAPPPPKVTSQISLDGD